MSRQEETRFPLESESQRYGRLACKGFEANVPNTWIQTKLDGGEDFGFDYQVQVGNEGQVRDIFRAQIKGTTNPLLNAARTEFSVPLSVSTINYYARSSEPVLLVLCDLSADIEHPKNCPLYYQWIQDDLERVNERGIGPDQESVTFHVSSANLLSDSTDLTADIERFRKMAKVGEQLDLVLRKDRPSLTPLERSELLSKLSQGLTQRSPAMIVALTDVATTSWPEAPVGSIPWHLKEALSSLSVGNPERAKELLCEAEKLLPGANEIEQADYWHVVGRLLSQQLDDLGARSAFEEACRLSGDAPQHLVAWAEADLRIRFQTLNQNDYSDTIARLNSEEPAVIGIKARFFAAEGRFDDAIAITETINGLDRVAARAIIFGMQAKNIETIRECDIGMSIPMLREKSKVMFLILKARAEFSEALGPWSFGDVNGELPMTGPAGARPDFLQAAWSDINTVIPHLRAMGWPANVEFLSDIWPATAAMVGHQAVALPIMVEAAATRPSFTSLHAGVESLAAQIGEFGIALDANNKQTPSDYVTLRRIVLLHLADRPRDCVQLMVESEDTLSTIHHAYGFALGHAILSAEKTFHPDLAARWEEKLESLPQHAPYLALMRYFRACSRNPLGRDSAIAELESQYLQNGRDRSIGIQLFHELDASVAGEAERCWLIARDLSANILLDIRSSVHLAQALVTLQRWDELLVLSDQATTRFETNDQLLAIGALALDNMGRTAEAHDRLQGLIDKPRPNPLALNAYIRIASRSGFTSEAVACLETLIGRDDRQAPKLECLKHLFALIHLSEPHSQRLVEIAWEIGCLTDQMDEAEEGLFLMAFFQATLPSDLVVDERRLAEFHRRFDGFTQRFPDSKILRRAMLPEDATAEQFIEAMRRIAGVSEARSKWQTGVQVQLQRGVTSIPYCWRPRHLFDNIADIPTLWEISKRSRWEDRQLHLTMAGPEWQAVPYASMKGFVPLLDLTTLLVVHDLGLFESIFKLFPKVAITKATLLEIQQLLSPISASPCRQQIFELQKVLKSFFSRIDQPDVALPDGRTGGFLHLGMAGMADALKANDYMLYSDDCFLRVYANTPPENPPSICTLDVLCALDELGILTVGEAARKIATLSMWRVELMISHRYQLGILPDSLKNAACIEDGLKILRADPLCNDLFAALWNPGKEYRDLQGHMGTLLLGLLGDPKNKFESITSITALWFSKARLHVKAPAPAERVIAQVIIQAAFYDLPYSEYIARRSWAVYHALVEHIHGDRMDETKYRESISIAGQVAAEIDHDQGLQGDRSIQERLGKGLTAGTSEADRFLSAYTAAMTLLKQKAKAPPR